MRDATKDKALKRLARIEGQVRGVSKMVDDGRYCIDVVRQVQAVKAALGSFEKLVLDDHLDTCVESALKSDDINDRRAKVEELVSIFGGRKS